MDISINDIKRAYELIRPNIHETPLLTSKTINDLFNCCIHFKCENLQKTGSFKIRGATYAVLSLSDDEAKHGVATHSSGNHAAALARAARIRGIKAHIVMPNNAPEAKKAAVKHYCGDITFCEPGLENREAALKTVLDKTGAHFIPAYNDPRIIAGQGTVAYEVFQQLATHRPVDMFVSPVGGGGLLSGCAIATRTLSPKTLVIGAEPLEANDAHLSFKKSIITPIENPQSICDGLLTTVGQLNFDIIRKNVDDIFTAKEETIQQAKQLIMQRMKIIVEPSAAITLAVIAENESFFKDKHVVCILSGGNIDLP